MDEIGAYRLGRLKLSQIPPDRTAALARYALGSKAPLLERAPEPERTAMLTAAMRHLEAKAIDEALDLFQVLMATRLLNTAKRKTEKERLSTLPQLEKASRTLARAAKVLFEELELVEEHGADLDVAALWAALEEVAPRAAVMTAAATVVSLVPQGAVDRDAYVVCVLEQLHRALNNRDVFASPSYRWSDPRARLLDGPDWDAVEEDVLAGLSLDMPVEENLAELVRGLDTGWKQLAERLEEAGPATKVSIEVQDDGRVKLNVDKLGALGEPKSLTWLRRRVERMLPKIDLPDLLFEVNAWTGFLDAFVHLGDGTTRMKDLPSSTQ